MEAFRPEYLESSAAGVIFSVSRGLVGNTNLGKSETRGEGYVVGLQRYAYLTIRYVSQYSCHNTICIAIRF